MKIEVAPWIRDYVVDMDDLYTELALEKMHNTPIGEEVKTLNHYSELFENCKQIEKSSSPLREPPAKICRTDNTSDLHVDLSTGKSDKILMKGDPGFGKTTQCKKISWDWAKRKFTQVDIVFFVSLKLVKPGDVLENVIIKQNPFMKGLGITEQKLQDVLRLLGRICLLILDGLDEHALGTNNDVLSIIEGKKHLKCNIIVTSRPHSTKEIEKYFPTVVRVEGFTRNKAEQFASKILKDQKAIEAVLNYKPGNINEQRLCRFANENQYSVPIHKCPILLSFLCVLAREEDIDLLNTKMHTGEIFARMVRCLYKKYVIREGLCHDPSQFQETLTCIGKLALKTLLSGDPLLKRADVIKEIGVDAFDYGLLIGHEDFRLFRDETADIFVTFPHRSIQEFLGALYFIWMLDQGKKIEFLLGNNCHNPIFLTNTLFLQFCLWFLGDNQKYFALENKYRVYQGMVQYSVDLVNDRTLDLIRIEQDYPALDISSLSVYTKDKLRVRFLGDILGKCKKASRLVLSDDHALNQYLGFVNPISTSITSIGYHCSESRHSVSFFKSTRIMIEMEKSTLNKLSEILKYYNKVMNNPLVYLHLCSPCSLRYSKKLSFLNVKTLCLSHVTSKREIEKVPTITKFSPNLRQLRLENISKEIIMNCVINQLCGDILPNLNHLSIVDCHSMVGELPVLIKTAWPHLRYFSLLETPISETDLEFLCITCNGPEKKLPNLTSLCVTFPDDISTETAFAKLFSLPWLNLENLFVDYNSNFNLSNVINKDKLPNLISLRIRTGAVVYQATEPLHLEKFTNLQSVFLDKLRPGSEFRIVLNTHLLSELHISSRDGLYGNLVSPIVHYFPKLNTLSLSKCGLKSQDLTSLAQTKINGGLQVLKHLDISDTELSLSEFKALFDGSGTWSELLSLDIRDTFTKGEYDQVMDYMNGLTGRGYLSSLQKLGIDFFDNRNVQWRRLEKVYMLGHETLGNITDAVFWGYLPTLNTLCIEDFEEHNAEDVRLLAQLGVYCHVTCLPLGNEFSHVNCRCDL